MKFRSIHHHKIAGYAVVLSLAMTGASPASAQSSFRNYRCADGTEFMAGFFQYDPRAHLQLNGHSVTLKKGLALSGTRYTGAGVTLRVTKAGATTLKQPRRPITACEST